MELQLEMQINTLESANLNAETMAAVKKAASALQDIHRKLSVYPLFVLTGNDSPVDVRPIKKVDEIMSELERGRETEEEIQEAMIMQPPDDVRVISSLAPFLSQSDLLL